MHCHSSICCWPKERPLLKLALMPWEQDILQPQPQEEGAFCHHRGNSITAMQTHPFLWDNILGFDSLLPEGSHLVMKVVGQGLPSDPALHHSLRQCQSTLLAWCGAQHTCDIFVPLSNALPGCSQQWQQLPSAPQPQQVTWPKDTWAQRAACTKAQAHLGKLLRVSLLHCHALQGLCSSLRSLSGHWQCQCTPQLQLCLPPQAPGPCCCCFRVFPDRFGDSVCCLLTTLRCVPSR